MLSNIGNSLLFINVLLGILIIYFSFQSLESSKNIINIKIYKICTLQSALTLSCFFVLVYGYVVSDFSLVSVYQNSHSLKPFFYKITGSWGNHEGSLLLWVIILTVFSFLFLVWSKNSKKEYRIYTLVIQNLLIVSFLLFIIFNSNQTFICFPA